MNMEVIGRKMSMVGLSLKKASPTIFIVGGTIGIVASMIGIGIASTKVRDVVDEHKKNVEDLHERYDNATTFSPDVKRKETADIYIQTGVKVAKMYGPSVLLACTSLVCILKSHNILTKRNAALAAAYSIVDKEFKGYRSRLIERFDEELDHELKYNIKNREIDVEEVDEKTGETHTVKKTVKTASIDQHSTYARFFCEGCDGWDQDPNYNLLFLRAQQDSANEKLRSRGYLTLNEVYSMLGMDLSVAGNSVGWLYDRNKSADEQTGDGYVDFGIYNIQDPNTRKFVNGKTNTVLLDFNVQGPIVEGMVARANAIRRKFH